MEVEVEPAKIQEAMLPSTDEVGKAVIDRKLDVERRLRHQIRVLKSEVQNVL
jgi:hypothetical protein